jgi:glucose/arabinose dehydrogenase
MNSTVLTAATAAFLLSGFAFAAEVKLPAPFHTPSVTNGPKVVEKPAAAELKVPEGFRVTEFASGFEKPRIMLEAPNGDILVAQSIPNGSIVVISDKDKDGKGDSERRKLIEGLDRPYGMTFWKDYIYVAEPTSLKRYKFDKKAVTVGKGEEVLALPGFDKGHWSRSIAFDEKGEKFYLGVGSGSNAAPDADERRATILQCNPDGKIGEIFAAGLRNCASIGIRPGTNELWTSVQERDGLGDGLVPDFFTHVEKGGFYGWPYAYFGANEDPRNAGQKPELVKKTLVPDVSLGAHMSVLDWKFYTGKRFPAKYRGGAFFAFHGSSNRSQRIGYSVGFLPFDKNGKPAANVETFMSGWMLAPDQREVWGRPTGITQLRDGSLLVSEDGNHKIWHITYSK